MGSIDMMSIRGIRSFSPDEEQTIKFYKPLTVIVGQNGCGKTTIIECLKYITTGALPPGARSGQSFIHDPKMAGRSEVKAQIKLRFTNRVPQTMVCVRNFQVTQAKKTLQFKALHSVLTTRVTGDDGNERKEQISSTCTEMDKLMPTLLGVSKPVLEHVVFCHQEDSNWPLQEGAVLKKRFDEIFEASRYTKALDDIKKQKKEKTASLKDLENELNLCGEHVTQAKELRQRLSHNVSQQDELSEEINETKEQISRCDRIIKDCKERLEKLEENRRDIYSYERQIDSAQKDLEKFDKRCVEEVGDHWMEDNEMDEEELKDSWEQLRSTQSKAQDTRQQCKEKLTQLKKELDSVNEKKSKLSEQRGSLESRAEAVRENIEECKKLASTVLENHGLQKTGINLDIETSEDGIDFSGYTEVEKRLSSLASDKESKQKRLKEEESRACSELDKEIEDAHGKLSKAEEKVNSANNEQQNLKKQLKDTRKKIQDLQSQDTSSQTESLERSVKRVQADLEEIRQQKEKNEHEKSIQETDKRLRAYKELSASIRQLWETYRAQMDTYVLLEERQNQLAKAKEDLDQRVKTHKGDFSEKVDLDLPQLVTQRESISSHVSKVLKKKFENKQHISERLQEARDKLTRYESDYSHVQTQFDDTRNQIQSVYSKIPDPYKDSSKGFEYFSHRYSTDDLAKEVESEEGDGAFADENTRKRLQSADAEQKALCKAGYQIANIPAAIHFFTQKKNCLSKMKNVCEAAEQVMQFVIKMSSDKCACCGRAWTDNSEKKSGKSTMKKLSQVLQESDKSPEEFKRLDEELSEEKSQLDQVDQYWKSLYQQALKLENLQSDMDSKGREKRNLKSNVSTLEQQLQSAEEELKAIEDIRQCASDIDNGIENLKTLERQVNDTQESVDSGLSELDNMDESFWLRKVDDELHPFLSDLNEIVGPVQQKQQESFSAFVSALSTAIETCEEKCSTVQTSRDRISALQSQQAKMEAETQDQLVRLQQQLTEVHASQSELRKLKDEQENLDKRINECIKSKGAAEKEVPSLKSVYQNTKEKRKETLDSYRNKIKEVEESLNQAKSDLEKLRNYKEKITQLTKENPTEKLRDLEEEKSRLDKEATRIASEVQQNEDKLAEADETIEDHKAMERELSLHSERHQKIQNIEELKTKLKGLKDSVNDSLELSSRPIETLHGEQPKTEKELSEYLEQVGQQREHLQQSNAEREGRKSEIMNAIKSDKEKLRDAKYKDIEERHRLCLIKHETTRIAVEDLDKFNKALDKALMKYHHLKISEVNDIIRDLWTNTYQGQDIEGIKIVSDVETEEESGSSSKKGARNYNYRLVMYKGDTELDMKGRCSAGQKVLASLIIRLALAEAFCAECGLLALDEPTTNLDHDNKIGLARALCDLIEHRRKQTNFQLIVITHDEEFVNELGSSGSLMEVVGVVQISLTISEYLEEKFLMVTTYRKLRNRSFD